MLRTLGAACAAALFLAPAGERLTSAYPEGSESVCTFKSSFKMQVDEVHVSLGDVELPADSVEGLGEQFGSEDETHYRCRNSVLEAEDGQPKRMRRVFEELREHTVENGEEKDKTGPVEGLALLLSESDGAPVAELEDSSKEVDARYLTDHRMARDQDCFLPEGEVAVGDEWPLDESALRVYMGMTSMPVLFEPDEGEKEQDALDERIDEAASIRGQARLLELTERDGLACAVIGFTIEMESSIDDLSGLGFELGEDMPEPTGSVAVHLECEGKLWHALAEKRPVAMEQSLQGTMKMQLEMELQAEVDALLKFRIDGKLSGETTTSWTVGE